MFQSNDLSTLNAALNHYPVPMFAAQRASPEHPFYLLCVNAAHTRSTGLSTAQVSGLRPTQLLEPDEGKAVEDRYASCATSGQVISYEEEFHLNGRLTRWETTLLPVDADGGGQRVIGTALTLGLPAEAGYMSDAEFYAAQAQMRLGQITRFLVMLEDHKDMPQDLRTGAMMMSGLNRSLDHMLQDLRLAAQSKPPQRVDTRGHVMTQSEAMSATRSTEPQIREPQNVAFGDIGLRAIS